LARTRVLNIVYTANPAQAIAANRALQGSSKATSAVLLGASKAVLGFTVGAVVGLVAVGNSFDKAYDRIRISTGATGDRLEGLKEDFKGVARQSGASFDKIGSTVADLNRRLGTTGVPLQTLTRQFLFLDARGMAPLETSIPAVTRLFGDWGVATEDQSATLDKLFRASQQTGVGVDTLSELMVQFGSPLRALGLDFDTTAAMFAKFEREGVNIQTALPGLKFALKDFAMSGREPAAALQETIEAIRSAKTPLDAMKIGFETFGRRAGPDMAMAIREGRLDLDDLITSIRDGSDTIMEAAADTSSFSQKLALLRNKVLVGLEPLATAVFTAFSDGISKLLPLLDSAFGWFDRLSPSVKNTTGAVVAAGGALAVLAALLVVVVSAISAPVAIAVALGAAIGGIGVAAVKAYQNFEGFRNAVDGVVTWFKDTAVPAVQAFWAAFSGEGTTGSDGFIGFMERVGAKVREVVDTAVAKFHELVAWVRKIWPDVQEAIGHAMNAVRDVVQAVLSVIQKAWRLWGDDILQFVRGTWQGIQTQVRGAMEVIKGVIKLVLAVINGDWGKAWDALKQILGGVWTALVGQVQRALAIVRALIGTQLAVVQNVFSVAWDWIYDKVSTVVEAVVNFVAAVWSRLVGIVGGPLSLILGLVTTVFSTVWHVVQTIGNAIWGFVQKNWGLIYLAISGPIGVIKLLVLAAFPLIFSVIKTVFNAVLQVVTAVWNAVGAVIRFAWHNVILPVFNAVSAVVRGVLLPTFQFLWATLQVIWNAIGTLIRVAWNLVILPIFHAGMAFIRGVFLPTFSWLRDTLGTIWRAVTDRVSSMWGTMKAVFNTVISFITNTLLPKFTAIKDGILAAFNTVKRSIGGIWGAIVRSIKTGINAGIHVINALIRGLNKVAEVLPGVDFHINTIGTIGGGSGNRDADRAAQAAGIPGFAAGAVNVGKFGPFMTDGIRAIVGEGNPRFPEYVIPTDPKFRNRALSLFGALGADLMARGGTLGGIPLLGIGDIIPDIPNPLDAIGDVFGAIRKGAAMAIFGPIARLADVAIGRIPWEFAQKVLRGFKNTVYNWVKSEDDKLPDAAAAGPGSNAGYSGGGVERWRATALQALAMTGSPASWIGSLLRRMNQESGGNPNAINLWDSNARRGDPSGGLMQNIRSAYASRVSGFPSLRGTNFLNPLGSIVASIVYTVGRYGSGPAGWDRAGGYLGGGLLPSYAHGAWRIEQDGLGYLHKDEAVVPAGPAEAMRAGGGRDGVAVIQHFHGITDPVEMARAGAGEIAWLWRVGG